MDSELLPTEQLSQMVFVHDYIQLVFQDERFSIYNRASITLNDTALKQRETGFADALVSLIGQRVVSVREATEPMLTLVFERGVQVRPADSRTETA